MKNWASAVLLGLMLQAATGMAQMTVATLSKVFEISPVADHHETATAFLAQVGEESHFITARHVFEGSSYPKQTTVYINSQGSWEEFKVTVRYSIVYDVAAFDVPFPRSASGIPLCDSATKIGFDQPLYFLGFPFGLSVSGSDVYLPKVLPFVKRAWVSGNIPVDPSYSIMVLDGNNNYGFSGGPVVIFQPKIERYQACVFGVVSGFISGHEQNIDRTGNKVSLYSEYNSGLMYSVQSAIIPQLFEDQKK